RLQLAAPGRHDFVVEHRYRALPFRGFELLDALFHNRDRLAHFFHADAIAVVAISVLAHGNVELHLGVAFVGLGLAQVPGDAGSAHHHARESPGPGILEADYADIDVALLENAVFREQFF